jgi:ADP-ribose pyrophosphatase
MEPWRVLESRCVYDAPPWMEILRQKVALPDGRIVEDYHLVQWRDYALIHAETKDGRVIMIRHYKHGVGRVNLTFPGGTIHEGEDPLEAARRELLEETGFAAKEWRLLLKCVVHANYGCGNVHFFQAFEAEPSQSPASGDLEQIEVVCLRRTAIQAARESGEIATLDTVTLALLAEARQ